MINLFAKKPFRIFFWIADEWSCPEQTKRIADKIAHCFLHFILVTGLCVIFKLHVLWALLISQLAGFLYEWIVDCWIFSCGASKFDLLANFCGALLASGIFWIGGYKCL